MQQKKQRERERKELDALGRRHLANVRVVQRNVVYVIGIGPRFAKEEVRHFHLILPLFLDSHLIANTHFALGRLFWQVWQNLEDPPCEENPPWGTGASHRALYHFSSA